MPTSGLNRHKHGYIWTFVNTWTRLLQILNNLLKTFSIFYTKITLSEYMNTWNISKGFTNLYKQQSAACCWVHHQHGCSISCSISFFGLPLCGLYMIAVVWFGFSWMISKKFFRVEVSSLLSNSQIRWLNINWIGTGEFFFGVLRR